MRKWIEITEQGHLFPDYDKKHRKERFLKWSTNPNIYYHATINDFDAFKTTTRGKASALGMTIDVDRYGSFFARDPNFALQYITDHDGNIKTGGRIIPVHLSFKKTFDLTDNGLSRLSDDEIEEFSNKGIDLKFIYRHMYEYNRWELFDDDDGELMTTVLKDFGYDSAILHERSDNGSDGTVIAVFSPSQIKSAIANNGSYDRNRNSISESKLDVLINPKRNQLNSLLRYCLTLHQNEEPLRAAIDFENNNLYVWDGMIATHGAVEYRYQLGKIIHLMIDNNKVKIKTFWRYDRLGYTRDDILDIVKSKMKSIMPVSCEYILEE